MQRYNNNHKVHEESNNFSNYFLYFGLLLLLLLMFSLYRTYGQYVKGQAIVSQSEDKVNKELEKQLELKKELELAQDQYFTEKILRDKLGMAKEGEIVIVLPPAEELVKIAPKYEKEEKTPEIPNWEKWWSLFF